MVPPFNPRFSPSDRPAAYIVGASGRSGSALCRALVAENVPVAAVIRNDRKWREHGIGCPFLVADLADMAGMKAALETARVVVSCAHARHIPAILSAAPQADRFVFLGSTRKFTQWIDDHARGVLNGEESFLKSGRSGVILHPTMIYGAEGENNVRRLASIVRRLPIIPLPAGGAALVQPIYQRDVTRAMRAALDLPWVGPHSIVIAGPEPMRYAEFVRSVTDAAGLKCPRVVTVPLGAMIAASILMRFIPGIPKVQADELRRLTEDKNFDIGKMEAVLKVSPLPLTEGLALTFGR